MKPHPVVDSLSRALLSRDERLRLTHARFEDAGHGYDPFGLSPQWSAMAAGFFRLFHDHYFRVTSEGAEHIPAAGPCILVSNHSGVVPIDAAMLWVDVLLHTHPPRIPRPVVDHFVPLLPFLNVIFARGGCIGGSRGNVEHLLDAGELLLIFPEGTTGIGKSFRRRYQLQAWRVGHAELAIRHAATIVPVAVIGAEEQFVQIGRIQRGASCFGIPWFPITLSPLPLPVHYHILYGEPVELFPRYQNADDPHAIDQAAAEVRARVEALIARGLAHRRGVFR